MCLNGSYEPFIGGPVTEPAVGPDCILAGGRSYRDYHTLTVAVAGLPATLFLLARDFNLRGINVPANVKIADLLPLPEYLSLLSQVRFVVVPVADVSFSAGDSVILQAMAAGKAVVATRSPSSTTYVEDGVTGLIVPQSDPASMRRAMQYLLDHPAEALQMGQNARKRWEERYTFTALAERVHAILDDVCGLAAGATAAPINLPKARRPDAGFLSRMTPR
jgi:glycosyltransferase involved in cell wall biosynthesis